MISKILIAGVHFQENTCFWFPIKFRRFPTGDWKQKHWYAVPVVVAFVLQWCITWNQDFGAEHNHGMQLVKCCQRRKVLIDHATFCVDLWCNPKLCSFGCLQDLIIRLEKEAAERKRHVEVVHSRISRDKILFIGPEQSQKKKASTLLVQVRTTAFSALVRIQFPWSETEWSNQLYQCASSGIHQQINQKIDELSGQLRRASVHQIKAHLEFSVLACICVDDANIKTTSISNALDVAKLWASWNPPMSTHDVTEGKVHDCRLVIQLVAQWLRVDLDTSATRSPRKVLAFFWTLAPQDKCVLDCRHVRNMVDWDVCAVLHPQRDSSRWTGICCVMSLLGKGEGCGTFRRDCYWKRMCIVPHCEAATFNKLLHCACALAGMYHEASNVEPHGRSLLFAILPCHAHPGSSWDAEHGYVPVGKWQAWARNLVTHTLMKCWLCSISPAIFLEPTRTIQ